MSTNLQKRTKNILNEYKPLSWYQIDLKPILKLRQIPSSDCSYVKALDWMKGNFCKRIENVLEVQNPILYAQFLMKLAEVSAYEHVNVEELVHCTSRENAESIVRENFNWRGVRHGKYGSGVSFSNSSSYANLQSYLNFDGRDRALIITDVIIGYRHVGDAATLLPEERYDTTVSSNGNVFVKYYDNEFYPKYLIHYDSYPIKSNNGQRYIVYK